MSLRGLAFFRAPQTDNAQRRLAQERSDLRRLIGAASFDFEERPVLRNLPFQIRRPGGGRGETLLGFFERCVANKWRRRGVFRRTRRGLLPREFRGQLRRALFLAGEFGVESGECLGSRRILGHLRRRDSRRSRHFDDPV